MKEEMKTISIEYRFTLDDGSQEVFNFQLDAKSLELFISTPETLPSWTKLSFHQCPNCSLNVDEHPYCPVAANIAHIVMSFDRLLSCDKIYMTVTTEERIVAQSTTAQRGISSLMGLVIANSGCPHTAFFRPMARFHLPLANIEETIFRAASMYLLAQYFLKKEGRKADFDLHGLKQIYENIHIVNEAMTERLRAATNSDLPPNAVILLDLYAQAFPFAISETLKNIRSLFTPYLGESTGDAN
jgi:hypothetical protein